MATINSLLTPTTVLYEKDGNITEISEVVKELSDEERNNYAMRFMYNDWMQKVMLSDGLDPDENYDW